MQLINLISTLATLFVCLSTAMTAGAEPVKLTQRIGNWVNSGIAFSKSPAGIAINAVGVGSMLGGAWALNRQKTNKMHWNSPNEYSSYTCGTSATINVDTLGFGSRLGLTNSVITLLDVEGNRIGVVMDKPLKEFLKTDRTPELIFRYGRGSHVWTVPEVPSGRYQLVFESVNAIKAAYSKMRFHSKLFTIQCDYAPTPSVPVSVTATATSTSDADVFDIIPTMTPVLAN